MADHDQRMKGAVQAFLPEFVALAVPDWAGRFGFASTEWLQQEVFLNPPQGERRLLDLVARVALTQPVGEATEAILHVEIESGESLTELRRRMPRYRSALRMRIRPAGAVAGAVPLRRAARRRLGRNER
jgi:hypothetical protein